jgi:hypothetical protein
MSDKTQVDETKIKTAHDRGFVAHQMLVGGKDEEAAKASLTKQASLDEQSEKNFEIRKEACVRINEKLTGKPAEKTED